MDLSDLITAARSVVGDFQTDGCVRAGGVGAAIQSASGLIYTGICVDASCGLGFCAEHSAIAEMLKNREFQVAALAAVDERGFVTPPCGRCRELLHQLSRANLEAVIQVSATEQRSLRDLLPCPWTFQSLRGAS